MDGQNVLTVKSGGFSHTLENNMYLNQALQKLL